MNELVKTATEIAGGLAATDFVKTLLTPTAELLGQKMKDRVERSFKKAAKAEPEFEANFQSIPHRILVPLIQGVALEEDETLHDMWSALLANSATEKNAEKVRPSFVAVLRQMAPDEAVMLQWMFRNRTGPNAGPFNVPFTFVEFLTQYNETGFAKSTTDPLGLQTCLQSLQSAQLIHPTDDPDDIGGEMNPPYSLTYRGLSFMYACLPPKPKSAPQP